jgi:hypothetical protein
MSRSGDPEMPLSPVSVKSRTTGKTHGTGYAPLPIIPNQTGGVDPEHPPSPTRSQPPPSFRALSKVPSISPSDSPSQMKPRQTLAKSPALSPIKSVHAPSDSGGPMDTSRSPRHPPVSPGGTLLFPILELSLTSSQLDHRAWDLQWRGRVRTKCVPFLRTGSVPLAKTFSTLRFVGALW